MTAPTPPVLLVVGGSDSGAGAGIQADLRTATALDVFATTAVTTVTAQNTNGVTAAHPVPVNVVAAQIDAIAADFTVAAAKTGFLARAEVVDRCAAALPCDRLVVDPVLVASDGSPIVADSAIAAYRRLFDRATVITPNFREAALLVGRPIDGTGAMAEAANELADRHGTAVVITGGHLPTATAVDAVAVDGTATVLEQRRVASANVHGTGCSLATATASFLARGHGPASAIAQARAWVHGAIDGAATWRLGSGQGPIDHLWSLRTGYASSTDARERPN